MASTLVEKDKAFVNEHGLDLIEADTCRVPLHLTDEFLSSAHRSRSALSDCTQMSIPESPPTVGSCALFRMAIGASYSDSRRGSLPAASPSPSFLPRVHPSPLPNPVSVPPKLRLAPHHSLSYSPRHGPGIVILFVLTGLSSAMGHTMHGNLDPRAVLVMACMSVPSSLVGSGIGNVVGGAVLERVIGITALAVVNSRGLIVFNAPPQRAISARACSYAWKVSSSKSTNRTRTIVPGDSSSSRTAWSATRAASPTG